MRRGKLDIKNNDVTMLTPVRLRPDPKAGDWGVGRWLRSFRRTLNPQILRLPGAAAWTGLPARAPDAGLRRHAPAAGCVLGTGPYRARPCGDRKTARG